MIRLLARAVLGVRGRLGEVLITGTSMAPAVNDGERWWYERNPQKLRLGEVLLIEWPSDSGQLLAKRVVALAGAQAAEYDCPGGVVPTDHMLVLSDDPGARGDSRLFGPVATSLVRGRLITRVRAGSWALPSRDWIVDLASNVDTEERVWYSDLDVDASGANYYVASPWSTLTCCMKPSEVGTADAFVDVGCGKGRVLIAAAAYPFRRIIGIEVSPKLIAVARRNVQRARRCTGRERIELRCADASGSLFPDEATVIYAFNPFGGVTFARFLERVHESLSRRPRRLRLLYRSPVEDGQLRAAGFVLRAAPTRDLRVYELDLRR